MENKNKTIDLTTIDPEAGPGADVPEEAKNGGTE